MFKCKHKSVFLVFRRSSSQTIEFQIYRFQNYKLPRNKQSKQIQQLDRHVNTTIVSACVFCVCGVTKWYC